MQLIFVVEASKESKSDFYYISETLKEFYNILGHKITPIYMEGKGNFNKKQEEINKNTSKYKGVSKIFFCYDIDNPTSPIYSLNKSIEVYAKAKGYETIWFYENVEQVYIKNDVHDSEKTKTAKKFVAHNLIRSVVEKDLSQTIISRKRSSNILTVIDKYLQRK